MSWLPLLLLLAIVVPLPHCDAEVNVCHTTTMKSYYSLHHSRHRSGRTVYLYWTPLKKRLKIRSKVCCQGWTGYTEETGCQLRLPCGVVVPQHAASHCLAQRDAILKQSRLFYTLNTPKTATDATRTHTDLLVPFVDQPAKSIRQRTMFDPTQSEWFNNYYFAVAPGARKLYDAALATFGVKQFTTAQEFIQMQEFFRAGVKKMNMPKFYYPTNYFYDVITNGQWEEDRIFAAKRLGGANPYSLRQVTSHSKYGVHWKTLMTQNLNPKFNWERAVKLVTHLGLEASIQNGRVFVVDFELLRGVKHSPDITDRNSSDNRVLRRSTAPIGLFATAKDPAGELTLMPVAIQYDYTKDSNVYKPTDGAHWKLAKMQVEVADFLDAQEGYHLRRTHLGMERFCACAYRHFTKQHPLGQLLHRHCIGTISVNAGLPNLLRENGTMHILTAVGYIGSVEIVNKAFLRETWDEFDMPRDVKRRGVHNKKTLPYFPYRDDGLVIHKRLTQYLREYIDRYYKRDSDVKADYKLQRYANELSAQGKGEAEAGKGMVNGFPTSIKTKAHLVDVLTRILFVIVDHSAANYAVNEMGSFVPSSPTKLYRNTAKVITSFQSLPDSKVAAFQCFTVSLLSGLHYDQFLDYAEHIPDLETRKIIEKYHSLFHQVDGPLIEKRNKERIAKSLFGYPYLIPKFLTNSVST